MELDSKRTKLAKLASNWNNSHFGQEIMFSEKPTRYIMQQWYSDKIQKLNTRMRQLENEIGLESTCQTGCAWCCHQPILVTPFEAIIIIEFLDQNRWWNTYRSKIISTKHRIQSPLERSGFPPLGLVMNRGSDKPPP